MIAKVTSQAQGLARTAIQEAQKTANPAPPAKPVGFDIELGVKTMQKYIGDNVILLKGPTDIIFTKHLRHLNKTGHNSMTIGGTGDILAGMCGAFVAQKVGLFESAVNAATINGRLGEFMYRQMGYGYTSHDMVKELWRFTRHGLI